MAQYFGVNLESQIFKNNLDSNILNVLLGEKIIL